MLSLFLNYIKYIFLLALLFANSGSAHCFNQEALKFASNLAVSKDFTKARKGLSILLSLQTKEAKEALKNLKITETAQHEIWSQYAQQYNEKPKQDLAGDKITYYSCEQIEKMLSPFDLSPYLKKSLELKANYKKCGFCADKRALTESFNENELLPALEKAGMAIQIKPNNNTIKQIIDLAVSNENSAAEGFSYALADAYISNPRAFKSFVKKMKSENDKKFILQSMDWGLQNHTDLPEAEISKLRGQLKE